MACSAGPVALLVDVGVGLIVFVAFRAVRSVFETQIDRRIPKLTDLSIDRFQAFSVQALEMPICWFGLGQRHKRSLCGLFAAKLV
jgi:hypothetical protein